MNIRLVPLLLLTCLTLSCADAMVTMGLQEATPPVTNSAYYTGQMDQLVDRVSKNRSRSFRKAAVLDFVNTNGKVSELGRYLTIKFSETAAARGNFKVIPSGQVKEALSRLKIVYEGALTKEEANLIGADLGADAVLTGVLADLQKGSDVDLSVKAIQASNGDLISAASITIYRSKQVQTLIQQF